MVKAKCWGCGKRFKGEMKTEIVNEVHNRYLECPRCQDKIFINFFCPDLQDLVDQVNVRAEILILNGQNPEKDIEVINLMKRINNLSQFLMKEAKRRSNGQPCYVETTMIEEGEFINEKEI